MRKMYYGLFGFLLLAACSEEEPDQAVEVTNEPLEVVIFESEAMDQPVNEDEIKLSIKTYLDSSHILHNQRSPFDEVLDLGNELNQDDEQTLEEINMLLIENDENFATYITANNLPDGYHDESARLSQYVSAYNDYLIQLDLVTGDEEDFSLADLKSLVNIPENVNGREQAEIEAFLAEKEIETRLFEAE